MRREGTCPSLGSCPQCHTTCATQNQKKVMTGSPPRPCTTRYLGSKLSAFTCLHVTCYIRMFGGRLRRTGGRTANPEPRNPKYSPSPFFVQKTLLTHTRHRRGALLGTSVGDPERSLRSRSTRASQTGHGVILPYAYSEVLGGLEMPPTRRAPRLRPLVAKYPFHDCAGRAQQAKRRWGKNVR